MPELQLTGLQKRAEKYINKQITYAKMPGEFVRGNFIGFDKDSIDRAVIQLSNAADRMTVPLMYVVNYFEEKDDAKKIDVGNEGYVPRPPYKPHKQPK
ncbi:hypothetical protein ACFP1I_05305 [Dyadobacter subterraneus]|uniref:Uncharacterized protein n=1 Tax=Dyadobacter subterraneus TaxID=2773304 RepID=A0ABR9WG05_9BACT|nr:hypothetical protein [Dyadobacter subterraneus]MBE9464452.1 hypothetical protein [Dyadobacter subterraneus]